MPAIPEAAKPFRRRSLEPGDRFCYIYGPHEELYSFFVSAELVTTSVTVHRKTYQFSETVEKHASVKELSRLLEVEFTGSGSWSVHIDTSTGQAYRSARDFQLGEPHSNMVVPEEVFILPPLPPIEKGIPF